MTEFLVMLNGPPRAGKDTATRAILSALADVGATAREIKVTEPVKDEAHRRLGLVCAHDAFEADKDTPLAAFGWATPRQTYIAVSSDLKRLHGPDVVCRLLAARVASTPESVVVVSDVGGDEEAEWLLGCVPSGEALLLRIHRQGHDFSQDCRDWVRLPPSAVKQADLDNDGLPEALGEAASVRVMALSPIPAAPGPGRR